ncbi:hypothetical protein GIB67_001874 [Kingdonia uniflora]|uniref:Uncharacterized protein n=1 Tax=Kingdonia uniflora TaxID=39325 RepID=A0A7J7LQE4_9MAGN|nr:hypothetical protein GIB67_001874 [Kingdonia uniflora]
MDVISDKELHSIKGYSASDKDGRWEKVRGKKTVKHQPSKDKMIVNNKMAFDILNEYPMNVKVPLIASNRRKKVLAREGDLLTYKRTRKTIDPSTVVPPNIVEATNEGVSKPVPITKSTQATLGAQSESAQASWIIAHFPKLAGIPKEMDSDRYEHCTCWKWDVSVSDRYGGTTLLKFRKALENYKLEDITIYTITFDLAADDDIGIHQRREASVNEYGDTPVHQSEDVAEQYDHHEHVSLSPNAHGTMQTRAGYGDFDQQIIVLIDQLQKLKEDNEKESEANIILR